MRDAAKTPTTATVRKALKDIGIVWLQAVQQLPGHSPEADRQRQEHQPTTATPVRWNTVASSNVSMFKHSGEHLGPAGQGEQGGCQPQVLPELQL